MMARYLELGSEVGIEFDSILSNEKPAPKTQNEEQESPEE